MKNRDLSRAASVLFAVALFFFILTFSISLPIYCRPFYYAHIGALNLPEASGYSEQQIRAAYNEVLDYLTLPAREFSSGDMAFSSEGAAHFADCKVLFDLNVTVLICSGLILAILLVLKRTGRVDAFRIGRRSAAFYSAVSAVTLPIIIGALAAIDFDRAFTAFHGVFFPGKDNWLFDPAADEIINVLPQEFFMNCAILIGTSVLVMSIGIIMIIECRNA